MKEKIAIVLASNLYKAPYALHYIKLLEVEGLNYDIFTWNRSNVNEPDVIAFDYNVSDSDNYFKRFIQYLKYYHFLKKNLKEYDKIVMFTIAPSILAYPIIRKKNYIIDIRDYSITLKIFKLLFIRVLKKSCLIVTSSKGFLKWLPISKNILISHNIPDHIHNKFQIQHQAEKKQVVIKAIGSIRDFPIHIKLIKACANNVLFRLSFHGQGQSSGQLKEFAALNNIQNVSFTGLYEKSDEANLLKGANLVNNLTSEDINGKTLMTNRFYLSVIYGIPMLVTKDTFQASVCKEYSLGLILDLDDDICRQIIDYHSNFDLSKYNFGRMKFLELVKKENSDTLKAIASFFHA
jgi:hypothetical protein